jgi:hypothetical protein
MLKKKCKNLKKEIYFLNKNIYKKMKTNQKIIKIIHFRFKVVRVYNECSE